jgi:hypothetical protein
MEGAATGQVLVELPQGCSLPSAIDRRAVFRDNVGIAGARSCAQGRGQAVRNGGDLRLGGPREAPKPFRGFRWSQVAGSRPRFAGKKVQLAGKRPQLAGKRAGLLANGLKSLAKRSDLLAKRLGLLANRSGLLAAAPVWSRHEPGRLQTGGFCQLTGSGTKRNPRNTVSRGRPAGKGYDGGLRRHENEVPPSRVASRLLDFSGSWAR